MTIMAIFEILFENILAPQTVEYSILVNEIIKKNLIGSLTTIFSWKNKKKNLWKLFS